MKMATKAKFGACIVAGVMIGHQPSVQHAVAAAGASLTSAKPPGATAASAVAFAESKVGAAYLWGGNGPAYDCSGLADAAYGGTLDRTSQSEWANERRVPASQVQAGDLVFFAGSDGTTSNPGHVGIVTDPARNLMVDAYDVARGVEYDTYGLPSSRQGLTSPVGFTNPTAGPGVSS
jgi:cell wall-associated NlpC family hydrolase